MTVCEKCGKPLEVSHIVDGKMHTHPCACRCMIDSFDAAMKRHKAKKYKELQEAAKTYGRRSENQGAQQGRPADRIVDTR